MFNHNRVDEQLARAKCFIGDAIADRRLRPIIDRTFPFDQAIDVYRYLASGAQRAR